MLTCASCSSQAPEGSRFCPNCASALAAPSVSPTRTAVHVSRSSGSFDQGRFIPGTIVAGRYRILGLLGKGGMGEVYRADDLKLGQAVALKFLPAALEKDEGRLERFMNEVKIARQISHTNVCRVYDVGEVDGHHYLSMEYVDGENLATLLRRIGRLPTDKAVQIARELCAGLASAHDQGVLHRDLKPANIMIDGRGRARITDFGLAGLADEITGAEVSAGTPAYMAPEQHAGRSVSVRSDLYSLGLVLYELFTGQAAFKAGSPGELQRLQTEATPTNPSTIVDGFDPVVERVILRCLEKEPRDRPASALAVAAALPGGDPLAAALAAGETPSPELVAEAGAAGGLRPSVAIATLAGITVLTLLIVLFSSRTQISRIVSPPKSPEALAERARETLERLGFSEKPVDSLYGFSWDGDYVEYIGDHDKGPSRWDALGRPDPPLLLFWYRQSPRYLLSMDRNAPVDFANPPLLVSGMTSLLLDMQGRLRELEGVPPQKDESKGPWPDPDWSPLFREAGLDPAPFKASEPAWAPPFLVDRRAAWEGSDPAAPGTPYHIEAAAYHGRPVYFEIIAPWDKPRRMEVSPQNLSTRIQQAANISMILAILIGGAVLARRNLRLGRGDRKGAFRVAFYLFATGMIGGFFGVHHVPEQSELDLFFTRIAWGLFGFGIFWVFYVALEPYLRRLWPQMIVSWVRLLNGRFRDPLVGRDVLIGLTAGAGLVVLGQIGYLCPGWLGLTPPTPTAFSSNWGTEIRVLAGVRYSLAVLFEVAGSLGFPLIIMIILLLLRLLLRRQWLAIGGFILLWTLLSAPDAASGNIYLGITFAALFPAVWLFVLFRYGFVALLATVTAVSLLTGFPMTFDFSAWYASGTLLALGIFAALAGYSFWVALAGRPVFGDAFLRD